MSTPIIQIEKLSIDLSGNTVLKDITVSMTKGEYVSIIGPNGAGKSTLIKCMAGIHRIWSGTIRINNRPFNAYELAKIQSYVPQAEGRMIPLSIEEFVTMGRYPHLSAFTTLAHEDRQVVAGALEQAGLTALRHRNMNTLSGGERQMAFIAAALAQGAEILLLDEPSTFLDYRHQAAVAALLKSACREHGITVVAVHHDVNTATDCSDRVYAIKDGAIAFEGTPHEIADTEILSGIYDTGFTLIPSGRSTIPFIAAGGEA
jgi:iron complex transport system ATP-binding protein